MWGTNPPPGGAACSPTELAGRPDPLALEHSHHPERRHPVHLHPLPPDYSYWIFWLFHVNGLTHTLEVWFLCRTRARFSLCNVIRTLFLFLAKSRSTTWTLALSGKEHQGNYNLLKVFVTIGDAATFRRHFCGAVGYFWWADGTWGHPRTAASLGCLHPL